MVPVAQQSATEEMAIGSLPVQAKVIPVVSKRISNYMDNGLKCNGCLIGQGSVIWASFLASLFLTQTAFHAFEVALSSLQPHDVCCLLSDGVCTFLFQST